MLRWGGGRCVGPERCVRRCGRLNTLIPQCTACTGSWDELKLSEAAMRSAKAARCRLRCLMRPARDARRAR